MKVYVASSWRNAVQPAVVAALRAAGHKVYDFKNPEATGPDRWRHNSGFGWSEIDPEWEGWDPATYRRMLTHPRAVEGFASDMDALRWADACVLVLPCGRSAHTEMGWAAGAGKITVALLAEGEPELMYRMFDHLALTIDEVVAALDLALVGR